uniref:Cl40696_1 n=1 Tax=Arundo donax TaxID=35708 RepID=A0A0A9G8T5_ARUDO
MMTTNSPEACFSPCKYAVPSPSFLGLARSRTRSSPYTCCNCFTMS